MTAFQKFALTWIASILAAFLFFWFFQTNTAAVDLPLGLQLGGPIGGAVAMLLVTQQALAKYEKAQSAIDTAVRQAQSKDLAPVLGDWVVYADSDQSDRRAFSQTRFDLDEGRLQIRGGNFYQRKDDDTAGEGIGFWTCEVASFDGFRLIYFYTLTDTSADQEVSRGYVDARQVGPEGARHFEGRWEVFGRKHHQGVIRLKRA